MPTEYDYIDIIGRTHETYRHKTDQIMNSYYHKSEVSTVSNLLKLFPSLNKDQVVDVGTSVGVWLNDYKSFGFEKVVGIDISEDRAKKAKERGYDEVHICNAYETPFQNNSQNCMVSNDVLVHVLQDSDKLKIFKEIYRVLDKNGIFIFNIANANAFGYSNDTSKGYSSYNTVDTIKKLLSEAQLKIKKITPSYFVYPRIGANPKVVSFSTKLVFPITDYLLTNSNNLKKAKTVYFCAFKE